MAGPSEADIAKLQLVQELELEMMADMYNRMASACHKKCIPPTYHEPDISKGEAVCLDRCVAKYLEIHERVGKKLTAMSNQDEDFLKRMQSDVPEQKQSGS
ncbi:mitochondrial import inner membrane translocase subunit Tim10 [Cimex lectularius]|uniref:Mitochondrial import inner membrane translocase subunit n=1 Tax=Cimex lectularius TaxID=79782 RepID=A0A8I6TLQ7_CIMLE|nr:mitochondrial import inner membrane translocase subunit Tim10 [Cimex lectularius]